MEADLSKRVSFRTDYKYAIWEEYVIIYKVGNEYVELRNDYVAMSNMFYGTAPGFDEILGFLSELENEIHNL